jgi:hypothetical protein
MSYLDAIAQLASEHRPQIESALAEARLVRDQAESALVNAEQEVTTLEAILAMRSPTTTTQPTEHVKRLTLHEAMRKVLQSTPGRRMLAADLATAIDRRGLYKMRDGRPVEAQQIHARVSHYGHMFERDGQGIRLV